MQRGEQVEERCGGVARQEIARVAQLLPRPKLPGQEGKGEDAGDDQADSHAVRLSPAGSGARPLHRGAARDQHRGIEPQHPRQRECGPVGLHHPHVVGADEQREQRCGNREKDAQANLDRRQGQRAFSIDGVDRPLLHPGLGVQRR